MMKDEGMCYVAEDPTQPGAAWAMSVDNPAYADSTAKDISRWIKKGANVLRVPTETAREMLHKWKRPEKRRHNAKATPKPSDNPP